MAIVFTQEEIDLLGLTPAEIRIICNNGPNLQKAQIFYDKYNACNVIAGLQSLLALINSNNRGLSDNLKGAIRRLVAGNLFVLIPIKILALQGQAAAFADPDHPQAAEVAALLAAGTLPAQVAGLNAAALAAVLAEPGVAADAASVTAIVAAAAFDLALVAPAQRAEAVAALLAAGTLPAAINGGFDAPALAAILALPGVAADAASVTAIVRHANFDAAQLLPAQQPLVARAAALQNRFAAIAATHDETEIAELDTLLADVAAADILTQALLHDTANTPDSGMAEYIRDITGRREAVYEVLFNTEIARELNAILFERAPSVEDLRNDPDLVEADLLVHIAMFNLLTTAVSAANLQGLVPVAGGNWIAYEQEILGRKAAAENRYRDIAGHVIVAADIDNEAIRQLQIAFPFSLAAQTEDKIEIAKLQILMYKINRAEPVIRDGLRDSAGTEGTTSVDYLREIETRYDLLKGNLRNGLHAALAMGFQNRLVRIVAANTMDAAETQNLTGLRAAVEAAPVPVQALIRSAAGGGLDAFLAEIDTRLQDVTTMIAANSLQNRLAEAAEHGLATEVEDLRLLLSDIHEAPLEIRALLHGVAGIPGVAVGAPDDVDAYVAQITARRDALIENAANLQGRLAAANGAADELAQLDALIAAVAAAPLGVQALLHSVAGVPGFAVGAPDDVDAYVAQITARRNIVIGDTANLLQGRLAAANGAADEVAQLDALIAAVAAAPLEVRALLRSVAGLPGVAIGAPDDVDAYVAQITARRNIVIGDTANLLQGRLAAANGAADELAQLEQLLVDLAAAPRGVRELLHGVAGIPGVPDVAVGAPDDADAYVVQIAVRRGALRIDAANLLQGVLAAANGTANEVAQLDQLLVDIAAAPLGVQALLHSVAGIPGVPGFAVGAPDDVDAYVAQITVRRDALRADAANLQGRLAVVNGAADEVAQLVQLLLDIDAAPLEVRSLLRSVAGLPGVAVGALDDVDAYRAQITARRAVIVDAANLLQGRLAAANGAADELAQLDALRAAVVAAPPEVRALLLSVVGLPGVAVGAPDDADAYVAQITARRNIVIVDTANLLQGRLAAANGAADELAQLDALIAAVAAAPLEVRALLRSVAGLPGVAIGAPDDVDAYVAQIAARRNIVIGDTANLLQGRLAAANGAANEVAQLDQLLVDIAMAPAAVRGLLRSVAGLPGVAVGAPDDVDAYRAQITARRAVIVDAANLLQGRLAAANGAADELAQLDALIAAVAAATPEVRALLRSVAGLPGVAVGAPDDVDAYVAQITARRNIVIGDTANLLQGRLAAANGAADELAQLDALIAAVAAARLEVRALLRSVAGLPGVAIGAPDDVDAYVAQIAARRNIVIGDTANLLQGRLAAANGAADELAQLDALIAAVAAATPEVRALLRSVAGLPGVAVGAPDDVDAYVAQIAARRNIVIGDTANLLQGRLAAANGAADELAQLDALIAAVAAATPEVRALLRSVAGLPGVAVGGAPDDVDAYVAQITARRAVIVDTANLLQGRLAAANGAADELAQLDALSAAVAAAPPEVRALLRGVVGLPGVAVGAPDDVDAYVAQITARRAVVAVPAVHHAHHHAAAHWAAAARVAIHAHVAARPHIAVAAGVAPAAVPHMVDVVLDAVQNRAVAPAPELAQLVARIKADRTILPQLAAAVAAAAGIPVAAAEEAMNCHVVDPHNAAANRITVQSQTAIRHAGHSSFAGMVEASTTTGSIAAVVAPEDQRNLHEEIRRRFRR